MIKGVNRQIVEICRTDDPYFERALLFVRADYADKSYEELEARGRAFLKNSGSYTDLRQSRAMCWFKRCVWLLTGGCCGVLLGAILMRLEGM